MDKFKSIEIQLPELINVQCSFKEHSEENILWVSLSGACSKGSQGENYGAYFYQKIGLSLLSIQPTAVLIDLQNLEYEYGDRILALFQVFTDIKIFGEDNIITAFVLSDKNKFGLSSILKFNIANPKPPLFYKLDQAYAYVLEEYDKV